MRYESSEKSPLFFLNFRESRTEPSSKVSNHLTFSSLLYFRKSRTGPSQASLHWAIWHMVRTPIDLTSSCCLLPVFSLFSTRLWRLFDIPDAQRKFLWPHLQSTVYMLHMNTPPSSRPAMQLTRHFHGKTNCILFNLGSRCTSSYTTHTTYTVFPQGHLRPVYFRQKMYFRLCHLHNLRGMSMGSSSQYPTLLDYIAEIQLRQMYLKEALYYLHSLCLWLFLRDNVCFLSF